jgi:ATP-dependent Clp protease ATP-binding subunit ClpA
LAKYCENLNEQARGGKIDPVLGRDKEMKQLVEILGKRNSPNVLIVGEPGVGKTSIVGGLALKLIDDQVPERLKGATIYELDVSGRLIAGAFKGEVEERMKSILEEVKAAENTAILFIDEIHILLDDRGPVGAGVVNLLKPELARGEIIMIGATTLAEYQKHIEKDSAFNRRFSQLKIEEPSELVAIDMLQGLTGKYEEFHGVKIQPAALTTSVFLAKKYIKDKHLPASAIELMDFTMSCTNQMNSNSGAVIDAVTADLDHGDPISAASAVAELKNQLSELLVGRVEEEQWSVSNLASTVTFLRELTETPKTEIEEVDIESITAYKSGIPIGSMRANEQEKLRNAKEILQQRVVGQDHVVDAVVRGLKSFRANLKEPNDPGAIFFFTGPTGTGKTELAKAIAELLFDDEDAMIRFDMSEFQESHSVATLLGAPPGYAGYDEGGILVNNVRKKPYSVVLFDEIEKAHQDIYGIFLQMLTDGRLQDKKGKMADFSNTIIIFTSNAGAHEIVDVFNSGRHPEPEELKNILRESRHFKDEFLGRVDSQILPFKPISEDVARLILGIHLNKFKKILKSGHNVDLTLEDNVIDHLIEIGFSPIYGARPLKNAIKSTLTPFMADKIIMGEVGKDDQITIAMGDNGELELTVLNEKASAQ